MSKMTPEEYKKEFIKTSTPMFKICYNLFITDIKITDSNVWKDNNDYNYKIRELNPFNPLSYVLLLVLVPLTLILDGVRDFEIKEITELFTYH